MQSKSKRTKKKRRSNQRYKKHQERKERKEEKSIETKRAFDISKNALLKAIIINYNYDSKRKKKEEKIAWRSRERLFGKGEGDCLYAGVFCCFFFPSPLLLYWEFSPYLLDCQLLRSAIFCVLLLFWIHNCSTG